MNGKLSDNRSLKTASDNVTVLLSGNNVGGASVHYWADSYRTPEDRLRLWAERYGIEGHGVADLTPAWDELTETLHVHPAEDEYFNRMNQLVRVGSTQLRWRGARVPQARHHCQKSGHCMQGCLYEAKKSQLVTHIPEAIALGARLYADVRAETLGLDNGRVTSLQAVVMDRATNRPSSTRKLKTRQLARKLADPPVSVSLTQIRIGRRGRGRVMHHRRNDLQQDDSSQPNDEDLQQPQDRRRQID
ncbi:MAG: GMC family oxidoreductase N-terminal domain-containing protein [Steroidobacteraceae bacterium]